MATNRNTRSASAVEVVDEIDMDTELDDDVLDVTEVADGGPIARPLDEGTDMGGRPANKEIGEDGGRWDSLKLPDQPQPDTVANTKNFHGDDRSLAEWQMQGADEVAIEPITVQDEQPVKKYRVRTITDVGPCFYGQHEFELQKGVLYEVPEYLFEYLRERNLIWSLA